MKLKQITAMLTIIFASSGIIHAMEPEKCPSVSAIQTVNFDDVVQMENGNWIAGIRSNNFDTNDRWMFFVEINNADNENAARAEASEAIKSLQFQLGPQGPFDVYWACRYTTSKGYIASSITPSIFNISKAASLVTSGVIAIK